MGPEMFLNRSLHVARTLLRGVHVLAEGGRLGCNVLLLRARGKKDTDFNSAAAIELRQSLTRLGGAFIKIGQLLSTRSDLLPPEVLRELQQLQDSAEPADGSQILNVLMEELKQPLECVFSEFGAEPVAAATIAQVHKATLKDGRQVAVKVQRPDVKWKMHSDICFMRLAAAVVETLFKSTKPWQLCATMKNLGDALEKQLSFSVEAENLRKFATNFASCPKVIFPKPIDHLVRDRVLVMEWSNGIKIRDYSRHCTQSERLELATIGFVAVLDMIFEQGFIHADLHPGNILVHPSSASLVFLDAGLVGNLSPANMDMSRRLFRAWMKNDSTTAANYLLQNTPTDMVTIERNRETFTAEISKFMERWRKVPYGKIQLVSFWTDLMSVYRRTSILTNADFTLMNAAIGAAEGLGSLLGANEELPYVAMEYLSEKPIRLSGSGDSPPI